jgi:putative ribosome biogenesis GTPase RsgA
MDKNIAAILREDAKTISVQFASETSSTHSRNYTYVTHFDVVVGDCVVVPSGQDNVWKICLVSEVHGELNIEPNSDIKYKWVVDVINVQAAQDNHQRNRDIEKILANTYRVNARQAYAQQFLSGADPKVLDLIKGSKS